MEQSFDQIERSALADAFEFVAPAQRIIDLYRESVRRLRSGEGWQEALPELLFDPKAVEAIGWNERPPGLELLRKILPTRLFSHSGYDQQGFNDDFCRVSTPRNLIEACLTASQLQLDEGSERELVRAVEEATWQGFIGAWFVVFRSADKERALRELERAALENAHHEAVLQVAGQLLARHPLANFEYLFFRNASVHDALEPAKRVGNEIARRYTSTDFPWPEESELAQLLRRAIAGVRPVTNSARMALELRLTVLLAQRACPESIAAYGEQSQELKRFLDG